MTLTIQMRVPCTRCGHEYGSITETNGQDVVRCVACQTWQYNAPRTETGREVRSLRTRPNLKPSTRSRVLIRDNATCVICHRGDVQLEVGHLVSVADGLAMGLTHHQLDDDENLAAMCATCNSGLSSETIPLRVAVSILYARLAARDRKESA